MTVFIASRHLGAMKWLIKHGHTGIVQTLWNKKRTSDLLPGDIVIGNLPIYVIEQILAKGAKVYLIAVQGYPGKTRTGKGIRDLTAEELEEKHAFLVEVVRLEMQRVPLDF